MPAIPWPAALPLTGRLTTTGAEWLAARASRADSVGVVRGDSAIRLRLWPISDAPTASMRQLCGAMALGRAPRLALDTLALPADSTLPALGRRRLTDTVAAGGARDPIGVRWIVPGAQAQYHFEGVTRDGAQRVSFRWPVRSDTSVRLPVGAPDSVIEAALQPSPDSLDALVRRVVASATTSPVVPADDAQPPRQVDAVALVSDLPFHVVALPLACPTATYRVPMIARVEQRVRIPVKAGDEVDAFASVEYGAVQVAFEEAGLDAPSARFTSVPRARVVAAADGAVTLRLALQVVSKQQRADQNVLLRLTRRHP
ncbi:MAG: hypothetical protein K2R93_13885 [Gemmatimonadaceae bacterium]|nr:hypothetical protein [Gemmatimonadaceae bacterium]